MLTTRTRLALAVAGAAVAVAVLPTSSGTATAQARWDSFLATAEADGIRVDIRVPGGVVTDQVADASAPRAQAHLDSLGGSTAYAASPFPGEVVVNAPGLASGPTRTELPAYPYIAKSSWPTAPEDGTTAGTFALTARSAARASDAEAFQGQRDNSSVGWFRSDARVERLDDDTVVAEARTLAENLVIGPVTFQRVESEARASRSPDGELERSSHLDVTGAGADGSRVAITPEGFVLGDAVVPFEADEQPFSDQGLTVRFLEGHDTEDGTVAPGLEVTLVREGGINAQGTSTSTYTIGRAAATVSGQVSTAPAFDTPPPVSDPAPPAAPPVTTTAPPPPAVSAPPVTVAPPRPFQPVAPVAAPEVADPADAEPVAAVPVRSVAAEQWGVWYVPLVIAAAIAVGLVLSLRNWGVKRVWA